MTEIIEVIERYEVPEIPALDLPEELRYLKGLQQ
jgi:hypothetical protein